MNSLPMGWKLAKIHEIATPAKQRDPSKSPDTPFRYVDVSSVSNTLFKIEGATELLGAQAPSRARKEIKAGDVLFATVRPKLKRIALVPPCLDGEIASTGYCVLHPNPEKVVPEFLYHSLLTDSFVQAMGSLERGASYPAIRDSDVFSATIPIPPLTEQRRIAHTLNMVRVAIEQQANLTSLTRELKSVLMSKLFAEGLRGEAQKQTVLGPVPESWEVRPLDTCAIVQTGVAKGRALIGGDVLEFPYLRVANVQDGYLDLTEMKTISIRAHEKDRYLLQKGDVVLTEGGDFDKLGRGFVWQGEVADCIHQNHVFAVRVNQETITPEFLAYQAQSPYGKKYFLSVAHKTSNLACINSAKLKRFPVLIPPLEEQTEISLVFRTLDKKLSLHDRAGSLYKQAFHALLHQLMTGQIRVGNIDLPGLT
jgi:type I restriction enzyme, S subunit